MVCDSHTAVDRSGNDIDSVEQNQEEMDSMTEAPNSIQPAYNSQEELEKILMGLSLTNGRLYSHIVSRDVNPRDSTEYKLVAETYYAVLQNVDHLLDIKAESTILSNDPKARADKVGELIEKVRNVNIGKIGKKCGSFIEIIHIGKVEDCIKP
jgi:hypothetical protein